MKIKFVELDSLYGSISTRVEMDPKLSLLVGINGSGKTSVLAAIDWILKPDLPSLALNEFRTIRIGFQIKNRSYVLSARKEKNRLTLSREGAKEIQPIVIDLIAAPSDYKNSTTGETELRRYYSQAVFREPHSELIEFISTIPTPLTILLDRTVTTDLDDGAYVDAPAMRARRERRPRNPLEKVAEVTRQEYLAFRKTTIRLNEELKDRLVISAFRSPFSFSGEESRRRISLEQIDKLEQKVSSLLGSSLGTDESQETISHYFRDAREFAKASKSDEKFRTIFWSQFRQIGELAQGFDDYERRYGEAYERIGSYLRSVNAFFRDSKKQVLFNELDGRLVFQYLDHQGRPTGPIRTIESLSSGERQILTMLTLVAFSSTAESVFIVDEPEISLHPHWQEMFLDQLLTQAPPETQIILATHSPEIVARHRERCIVLHASGVTNK